MSLVLPMTLLAGGAGLGFALLAATEQVPAQARHHFDPVLSGALCAAGAGNSGRLLAYYQEVAAATETRPFPPPVAGAGDADDDAPLYDNLGSLSYPITTRSRTAQRYFNQGLRLAYGFNHAEAMRAFRTAQKHDPDCAMCAFGEALVLGPNINASMDAEAVAPALAAATLPPDGTTGAAA